MVTRDLVSGDTPPSSGPAMSNSPRSASESSRSSATIFTPLSTTSAPESQRASSPIFIFGNRAASPMSHATPSRTPTGTPLFTPPSTTFTFNQERVASPSSTSLIQPVHSRTPPVPSSTPSGTPSSSMFIFRNGYNPDRPMPSIERDFSSAGSRQSTPSTIIHTPSNSTRADSTLLRQEQDADVDQIGDFRNLRLTSPKTPVQAASPRNTSTPSIQVTPSTTPAAFSQTPASTVESLVGGINAMRMESLQADPPDPSGANEHRSPSPGRRRRSGSAINKEPHQLNNEDPPQALFHMQEVQEALASARSLASRLVNVLSSSGFDQEPSSSIATLHRQAAMLSAFQLPSSRIVGLVGDSGVGKSSLINSLLDKEHLARASGSGRACTCAVTEYYFHNRDDFIIRIDYFTLPDLRRQFEELLTAYRDFQSPPESSSSRNTAERDEEINERSKLQETARLAQETFRASFGERLDQTPAILSSMAFENAVETMVEWASELLPREGGEESYAAKEECSARLKELTSESHVSPARRGFQTHWPFIRKLRVYLNAHILSKGLVIADLPGLRDLNSARKVITERYVRQCHQILVVARIDRAGTDESIKDIFELARRADLSDIDIICTRSEEVREREACDDWPAERATLEKLRGKIAEATRKMAAIQEVVDIYELDQENLTREEERDQTKQQQELVKVRRSKEKHEFEFFEHVVKVRNESVSQNLKNTYRNHRNGASPNVFCVSNKLYEDNRSEPAINALPKLLLSGIIELRRYCIGIVAESHLRATRRYIGDKIPAFLGRLELWVEAGSRNASVERKQQILDAVSRIRREIEELTAPMSQANNVSRNLNKEFNSQLDRRMRQNCAQWAADAKDASTDWHGWSPMSYKAFCAKYGEHSTQAVLYHCWNEEAMAGMKEDMSPIWDSFVVDLDAHLDLIKVFVTQSFGTTIRTALAADATESCTGNTSRSALRTLTTTLRHMENLTLNDIEDVIEDFQSELMSLHTDAFSPIRTAFIGKGMENAYHEANMDYGSGSDRRRKNLITGRFGSLSLFNDHRREVRAQFKRMAQELEIRVKEVLEQQVESIEADLELLRDENVVLESERDPGFRMRVAAEVEDVRSEVDRIGRVIANVS